MSIDKRVDDASAWSSGDFPPGITSPVVNIVGGTIVDVAGDYQIHGDVFKHKISIHHLHSG